MLGGERDARYMYPGQYHHYETHKLVHTARVFIGNCLASSTPNVVWFERAKSEDGKWQSGVFVAEVIDDALVARRLKDNAPKLAEVVSLVKKGSCRELRGGKGYIEP